MSVTRFLKSFFAALLVAAFSIVSLASNASASVSAVTFTGNAYPGNTLVATAANAVTPTYQWYDCTGVITGAVSAVPEGCTAATGTGNTASSYTLANSDFGFNITVAVTDTTVVAYASSVWFGNPKLTGSLTLSTSPSNTNVGSVATASDTSPFTGALLTPTYQWYGCSAQVVSQSTALPVSGTTCTAISGATSSTYTLSGSDAGKWILYSERVTNAINTLIEYSPSTATAVVAVAPSNSVAPAITNQTTYGVTVSSGSWNGTPAMTDYTYQWYNCTAAVGSASATLSSTCSAISGATSTSAATSASYSFSASDITKYVIVGVTASNGVAPTATQYSTSTSQIAGAAPSVLAAATISGTASVGSTLTLNNATWGGFPVPTSFVYAWYSCTSGVTANALAQSSATITTAGCTQVSNSSTSLVLTNQAVVIASVTATNSTGSYSSFTASSAITQALTPTNATDATITGGSTTSGVFTATSTSWVGVPTPTLSYQWYSCTAQVTPAVHSGAAPSNLASLCTAISGATASTYASIEADMTKFLLVKVTGTNATASYAIYSASTGSALADSSPVNTAAPVITGTGVAGSAQTASTGTWTTLPAPSYTYQWYVCNSGVVAASSVTTGCTAVVSNGTTSSYTPTVVDKATYTTAFLMVAVTATSHAGTVTTYSAAGTQLSTAAPSNASAPTVPTSSSTTVAMVATAGTWQGSPAPSLSYQWYVCSQVVASPGTTVPTGCSNISGATSSSYTPSGQYAGSYFLVAVNGANGVNTGSGATSVTVFSSSTVTPLISSVSINSLTISGTTSQGSLLTSAISVTSYGTYSTAYQWYSCLYSGGLASSVPYGCSAISGATSSSFTVTSTQVGYYITVSAVVTGTTVVSQVAQTTAIVTTNIPGVPTNVSATAGIASATITWIAPATGAAVSTYTVTSSPAGLTCAVSTTTCTIYGLNGGTTYTFTVIASNGYGSSTASSASGGIIPTAAVPNASASISAVAGNASATVTWSPATANGSAIAYYTVTSTPAGGTCTTSITSCVIPSLTNGTAYTFRVVATNLVGSGTSSVASNAVTPATPAPNAPTNVIATAGNAKVTVKWDAATTSGTAVTGYTVQLSHTVGTGSVSTSCVTTTARSCVFSMLINGATYTATVQAINASGTSVASAPVTAMPIGVSTAPGIAKITALSGAFSLIIRVPTFNGGSTITKYQYSVNGGIAWKNLPISNVVTGLKHRAVYTVYIRSLNGSGFSPKSNAARVITK